jgi:hypothetical protein
MTVAICAGLVLMAGVFSGLTLGLLSLTDRDLFILKEVGATFHNVEPIYDILVVLLQETPVV